MLCVTEQQGNRMNDKSMPFLPMTRRSVSSCKDLVISTGSKSPKIRGGGLHAKVIHAIALDRVDKIQTCRILCGIELTEDSP